MIRVGDRRLVFDAAEWAGRDVGDNEQFWHPATIVEWFPDRGEQIATVHFEHNNKLSRGHIVSHMRSVESS